MITDEMVEKAEKAFVKAYELQGWQRDGLRAALEAVAPMLIADYQQSLNKLGEAYDKKCEEIEALRDRASPAGG